MPRSPEKRRLDLKEAEQAAETLTSQLNKEYPEQQGRFTPEQYAVFDLMSDELQGATEIAGDKYDITVNADVQTALPPEFVADPVDYIRKNGKILKQSSKEKYSDEEIIQINLGGQEVIVKRVVGSKKIKVAKTELAIDLAAQSAGLSGARAFGFLTAKDKQQGDYLLMDKVDGVPLIHFMLEARNKLGPTEAEAIRLVVNEHIKNIAAGYREKLGIDKNWQIKDFMIDFDWDKKTVKSITPLDWERVKLYEPDKPREIDQI